MNGRPTPFSSDACSAYPTSMCRAPKAFLMALTAPASPLLALRVLAQNQVEESREAGLELLAS